MRTAHKFMASLFVSFTLAAPTANPSFGFGPLTSQQLVKAVLERNPSLPRLRAAAEAAAFRAEPAGSLDDPVLSYTLAPQTIGSGARLSQAVDLSQEIPWPGTLRLREGAARSEAVAARQELADLRLQIIAAVKAGFAEWYYVHRALAINEANRKLLTELRNVAETQYAAGQATQQDVIQAELEHDRLLDEALAFERERRSIQAQLNGLLNRAPGAFLPSPGEVTPRASPPSLRVLLRIVVDNHPELKRLEAQRQASRARLGLAEKNFYPDLGLNIGYDGFWEDEDQRFSVGASINIPLNRRKYRALKDAAQANALEAQWRLADRRAQLLANVGEAQAAVAESIAVIELYQDRLISLAQDNLNAAVADYRAGAGDFTDVITAENRKLMTELRLARARANYVRRVAELERWTGRNDMDPVTYGVGEVDD